MRNEPELFVRPILELQSLMQNLHWMQINHDYKKERDIKHTHKSKH